MSMTSERPDPKRQAQLIAELRRDVKQREKGYRARALKIYPHICTSCGREFSGKRLRELTVHHKDHDHDNNPSDGSNWELLCVYCHDHEHEKFRMKDHLGRSSPGDDEELPSISNPFEGLDTLMNPPGNESKSKKGKR